MDKFKNYRKIFIYASSSLARTCKIQHESSPERALTGEIREMNQINPKHGASKHRLSHESLSKCQKLDRSRIQEKQTRMVQENNSSYEFQNEQKNNKKICVNNIPSPSLSKRLNASLNSEIWSSVS